MTRRFPLLILCLALSLFTAAAAKASTLSIDDKGTIWEVDDAGARNPLALNSHYTWAADGAGKIYGLHTIVDNQWTVLAIRCAADGTITQRATACGGDIDKGTAIVSIEKLADGRFFAVLHIDPDLCVGVALDAENGKHETYRGSAWNWSPNGKHVVYVRPPPHFSPKNSPAELCMDDRDVRTILDSGISVKWTGNTRCIVTFDSGAAAKTITLNATSHPAPAAKSKRSP